MQGVADSFHTTADPRDLAGQGALIIEHGKYFTEDVKCVILGYIARTGTELLMDHLGKVWLECMASRFNRNGLDTHNNKGITVDSEVTAGFVEIGAEETSENDENDQEFQC